MSQHLDPGLVARRVRELPALPAALNEVLAAMRNPALRTDRFAHLIESDQALCGRTLRLANSAFYGLQGRVGTVQDALQLLGLRTVGNLMTAASLAGYADSGHCPGFDFKVFWRHSVAVSIAAREIAQACGFDGDQACVTGLLHDTGLLALAAYFPNELAAALDLAHSEDCEPVQAERKVLGLDHCQVGGMLAQHWCLPPAMVQAIRLHHEPPAGASAGTAGATLGLIDAVHLADAMAHALEVAQAPQETVPEVALHSWERVGAQRLDTDQIFARIEDGVASMAASLGM